MRKLLLALLLPVSHGRAPAPPFDVGERLTYDVAFGAIHVGKGAMEITRVDTIRNRPVWRAVFTVSGGLPGLRVRDSTISWFDPRTFSSLRFVQRVNEIRYHADREFQIYPEREVFVKRGEPEQPSVSEPLDDASFVYFVRTLPLHVGDRYEFRRYFRPEGNPVVINVVRRERVKGPAAT